MHLTMRLFVAIDIRPEVASAARSAIADLRERAARLAPRSRITWVAADRLHLTLRFVGDANDRLAASIEREMTPPLELAPFTIELSGLGQFPPTGSPRVVWVGVAGKIASLQALTQAVSNRLEMAGVPGDRQPFHPHLTLARIREPAGLRTAALFQGLSAVSLGTCAVESVTLYASRLLPQGPEHRALLQTPLIPAGAAPEPRPCAAP